MKNSFRNLFLVVLILLSSNSYSAKYIFYFIGDGMGLAHITLTEGYLGAISKNEKHIEELDFTKFPVVGLVRTFSKNKFITDSAAAGTALATGNKTNFEVLSMDELGNNNMVSIAEIAKKRKMKVAIITTTNIDDATPAVFYSHQKHRKMHSAIDEDMVKSNFDLFAGGGIKGEEKDQFATSLANNNYEHTSTRDAFLSLKKHKKTYIECPKLDAERGCPYSIDQDANDIKLSEVTNKAIDLLYNPNGFFMMIEGGKIDWASHINDAKTVVGEVIEFNDSIKEALKFYRKHPKETLIIVTSDHETGGLGLGFKNTKYEMSLDKLKNQTMSSSELSKLFLEYKISKSNRVSKADAFSILQKHLGLGNKELSLDLTDAETTKLETALKQSLSKKLEDVGKKEQEDPFISEAIKTLNNKSGIGWTTLSHTAVPVVLFAIGAQSFLFDKYLDNTEVGKNLIKIVSNKK